VRGILILLYFNNSFNFGFAGVEALVRRVNLGAEFRLCHAIAVNLLFVGVFMHIYRGLAYANNKNVGVWARGWRLFLGSIGISFLGYVLP